MRIRSHGIPVLLGALFLVPILMLLGLKGISGKLGSKQPYREWVDNTGQFSARARLQTDNGQSIILQRSDGAMITVPMSRLSEKDRYYLAHGESESRKGQVFPFSFGKWNYSNPNDLWTVFVEMIPLWAVILIPFLVSAVGGLFFWNSR